MDYGTRTGHRILRITCTDCDFSQDASMDAHARGIAAAAIRETTKIDQIDTVEIVFRRSDEDSGAGLPGPFSYKPEELSPGR